MTYHFIGRTFQTNNEFGKYENYCISSLLKQIDKKFPDKINMFINTTWFDQTENFDNINLLHEFNDLVKINNVDNLFFLASTDPTTLNRTQIEEMRMTSCANNVFLIGHYDDSLYSWNFCAVISYKHFKEYNTSDLILKNVNHKFLNYNRKTRPHRTSLIQSFIENDLMNEGIITLGKNPNNPNSLHLHLNENLQDYKNYGQWFDKDEFNLPHDMFSLGKFDIWQNHFLNVVSEVIFDNNDETFVSEKTWKPIIGLRPFILNGQTKIYEWLRTRGFKTFTHYFPIDNIERPDTVHQKIIEVLQYIKTLSTDEILNLYNTMLPDLLYNRTRFFEFAREEKNKIEHMFD